MECPSDVGDRAALTVYSDWLSEQGDPHGELIAAALAGNDARAAELLEEEADALLGELGSEEGFRATWTNGFIVEARLGVEVPCWTEQGLAVSAVFRLRTAQRLESLDLGDFEEHDADYEDVDTFEDFERAIELLARVKVPPTFRRLAIRPRRMALENVRIGDLSAALENMPALEALAVDGSDISFGDATLPNVRRLSLATPEPAPALVEALLDPSRLASLEVLDLRRFVAAAADLADLRAHFGTRLLR